MKKNILDKFKNFLIAFQHTSEGKNISPHLFEEASCSLNQIEENEREISKALNNLMKELKKDYGKNTKKIGNFFSDMHFLLSSQEDNVSSLEDFFVHLSCSLVPPFIIAPDKDFQRAAQITISKKFKPSVSLVDSVGPYLLVKKGGYLFLLSKKLETVKILIVDYYNKAFVHLNIVNESYTIIRIPVMPLISPLYWWYNDEIVVGTKENSLFSIDLVEKTFKGINKNYKKNNYQLFYDFYEYAQGYEEVKWADPANLTFTFLDRENQEGGVVNFLNNEANIISIPSPEIYTLYYDGLNNLFLIGQETIEFYQLGNEKKGVLRWVKPYLFRGIAVVDCTLIVASLENTIDRPSSFLTAYMLT